MALYKKVPANRKLEGEKIALNREGLPVDRGLPAVPRGLNREMTAYLQSLHNVVLSMTGLGRGTGDTRAVRVSERLASGGAANMRGKEFLDAGSVLEAHIANGAVTEAKIADRAVSHAKLGLSAVESGNIKPEAVDSAAIRKGAVIGEKLADGSVSLEKLAPELLPVVLAGSAKHGETVTLGKFTQTPFLAMTRQKVPIGSCGELVCGITNLREESGVWRFDVKAAFEMGNEDGFSFYPGEIGWMAIGIGARE